MRPDLRQSPADLVRLPPTQSHGQALLQKVNAEVNRRVRYASDPENYGVPDYWATAAETLERGSGDCEDVAIAKMHLLAAAGLRPSHMTLMLVRDLARNTDHAVLMVRLGPHQWMLDNTTDRLLDASQSNGYVPILSFSTNRRWLHGFGRQLLAQRAAATIGRRLASCRIEQASSRNARPHANADGARAERRCAKSVMQLPAPLRACWRLKDHRAPAQSRRHDMGEPENSPTDRRTQGLTTDYAVKASREVLEAARGGCLRRRHRWSIAAERTAAPRRSELSRARGG